MLKHQRVIEQEDQPLPCESCRDPSSMTDFKPALYAISIAESQSAANICFACQECKQRIIDDIVADGQTPFVQDMREPKPAMEVQVIWQNPRYIDTSFCHESLGFEHYSNGMCDHCGEVLTIAGIVA